MTCEELLKLLPDYLDDEVKAELCRELEDHMRVCSYCRGNIHTFKGTMALTRHLDVTRTHADHQAWVLRLKERVLRGPGPATG